MVAHQKLETKENFKQSWIIIAVVITQPQLAISSFVSLSPVPVSRLLASAVFFDVSSFSKRHS